MKTRKVIGTGTVVDLCGGVRAVKDNISFLQSLALGTEVELAYYEDAEPERELIVPEGIRWVSPTTTSQDTTFLTIYTHMLDIHIPGVMQWIANIVRRHSIIKYFYDWCIWSENRMHEGSSQSIADAQRAIYWKLADLGLYGFGWRTKESEAK